MQIATKYILIACLLITRIGDCQTLVFKVNNESPCAGQIFTLTLPQNCKYQRLVRSQLTVSPKPDSIVDVVDHTPGHEGVVGVSIKYRSYQNQVITITAPYSCDGITTGYIIKTIQMAPPVSRTPTISGLDGKIYSGDVSSVAAVLDNPGGITYLWQVISVTTTSGSIASNVIANSTSGATKITWPSNFVGSVDVKVTAARCGSSTQQIKRINILTPPAPFLSNTTSEPAGHCTGSIVRYRLYLANNNFNFLRATIITTVGVMPTIFATQNNVPVEWSVQWNTSGSFKVDYLVSDGNRTWSGTSSPVSFTTTQFDPGKVRPIPVGVYCGGYNASLTFETNPSTNDYTWQYCTNNCTVDSRNWVNNNPPTSPVFSNITTTTYFRTKISNACGTFLSSPVFVPITPTPQIISPDKVMFSGGSFEIPASSVPLSIITVTSKSFGVSGARDTTIRQSAITSGAIGSQLLTTTGASNGMVKYLLKASNGNCVGRDSVTVQVYTKPVVYSDKKYVYKDVTATLTTGVYDSYEWRMGNNSSLAKTAGYQTAVPGDYKVVVTKGGLTATSDVFTLGDQFDGVEENYVLVKTPLKEFTSAAILEGKTETDVSESIQYFDGIGRPIQNIAVRSSPNEHHDFVQPVSYDRFGREFRKFLPYVSSEDNGRFQPDAITSGQPNFYHQQDNPIPSDPYPFSETVFEKSPLNRVLKQGSPGAAWQPNNNPSIEHVVKFEHSLNTVADSVYRFCYDIATASLKNESIFQAGVLYRNTTTDEDKNDVIQFVDKLDRTICKKVKAGPNLYAITYYVYDDLGNLVVVIPPEGVRSLKLVH